MLGNGKYVGIAASPTGKLYCAPWNASEVLSIDPTGSEDPPFTFITEAGDEPSKYHGLCAAADGKLYCAPHSSSKVLVIDPLTERLSFIEGFGEDEAKYWGISCSPCGGWLHCAPWDA